MPDSSAAGPEKTVVSAPVSDPSSADQDPDTISAPLPDGAHPVPVAVSFGWDMSNARIWTESQVTRLGDYQVREATRAGLGRLLSAVSGDLADRVATLPELGPSETLTGDELHAFEDSVRELLSALPDRRVPKAYRLGHDLCVLAGRSYAGAEAARSAFADALPELVTLLDDLADVLPPHSASAVADSLERWDRWLQDARESLQLSVLPRQGELFRGVLAGERDATGLLDVKDYIDAARGLAAALDAACEGAGTHQSTLVELVAPPLWSAFMSRAVAEAITLLPDGLPNEHRRREMALKLVR